MTPAARLADLSKMVRRLSPDWSNPERFHENKSEIEHALRRLAKALENQ